MATGSDRWQNSMSGILALCAIAAVVMMWNRTHRGPDSAPTSGPPEPVAEWESVASSGHVMGAVDPTVTIVEFGDFECPVCGSYHRATLRPYLESHPNDVRLVYRHWPLPYHRFAMPAARASECAARQGEFGAYHDELLAHQDSLGLRSFVDIARITGVLDTVRFKTCLAETGPLPTVERDVELANRLGGTGTPTILVNGYRWLGLPTTEQLDSIRRSATRTLAGAE